MPSLSDMKVVYDLLRQRRQPNANYHQMDGQSPHPTNGTNASTAGQCSVGAPVPTSGQSCASEHIISIDSIHINKELGVGEFGVVQQGMHSSIELVIIALGHLATSMYYWFIL